MRQASRTTSDDHRRRMHCSLVDRLPTRSAALAPRQFGAAMSPASLGRTTAGPNAAPYPARPAAQLLCAGASACASSCAIAANGAAVRIGATGGGGEQLKTGPRGSFSSRLRIVTSKSVMSETFLVRSPGTLPRAEVGVTSLRSDRATPPAPRMASAARGAGGRGTARLLPPARRAGSRPPTRRWLDLRGTSCAAW